jgi:enoyl-CoA hydratase/carnithine racemase
MGYLLTGQRISAGHAMKLGLVNEVVPLPSWTGPSPNGPVTLSAVLRWPYGRSKKRVPVP